MGKLTFKGGVHPYDGKELSKDKPIKDYLPKGMLYFPLSQHIGAPAKAIVEIGQHVKACEMIAEAGGFVSAPIYSSVSGTVKGIENRRTVTGDNILCIAIENDGEYDYAPKLHEQDPDNMKNEEIIAMIQKAGIVGMGGAGFPTHVKLSPKEPEKIDHVIVNCAECEPYLTSDYRKMLEESDKLIKGLQTILKLFKNAKGYLAIEDNKPDCIKLLKDKTKDIKNIEVCELITKYPQGSERHLIYAVTGRQINSKMLPADAGCVVNNVDTVISIYNAIYEGRPLVERIVTVTGDAVAKPQNYRVKIGTLYSELLEEAGGFSKKPKKIISGGPMMGFALFDTDVPVTKTTSAILCLSKDDIEEMVPTPCINCGRCVGVCPSKLVPSRLANYADNFDEEAFSACDGLECVECGSCSYVCPAKRYLAQSIKSMRKILLAKNRKK